MQNLIHHIVATCLFFQQKFEVKMDDFHYTTGTTDSTSDDGVMSNMHVNSTQGLKVSTIK